MLARFRLTALAAVVFLMVFGLNGAAAQSAQPAAPLGPQAILPQRGGFAYNACVDLNGQPITKPADIQFTLWDSETGGTQIGGIQEEYIWGDSSGCFRVYLNDNNQFGIAFIGETRWLQLAVRYPHDSTGGLPFTTLPQRLQVAASPYAVSLVPGAEVLGTVSNQYALVANLTHTDSSGGIFAGGKDHGLYGFSISNTGVYGDGGNLGVYGIAFNLNGIGVQGVANKSAAIGVSGIAALNTGVYGSGGEIGVWGYQGNPNKIAVYGKADAAGAVGVWGTSAANTGVFGYGGTKGVWGTTDNPNSVGVFGEANAAGGVGIYGHSQNSTAVYGNSWNGYALWGESTNSTAVYARTYDTAASAIFATSPYIGLRAETTGVSSNRYAIYGENFNSSTGWAGWFNGNVNATGTVYRPAGGFAIDHPLDPANMTLSHSTVESPDMKDMYDGVAVTDAKGVAVVVLPAYFEALNKDFRYQLTVVGVFAQAIISKEIANNQFTIMTDQPNVKVSWQVTGIRRDAYAAWQPMVVETMKTPEQRGRFWQPQAFGFSPEMGIDYVAAQETPAMQIQTGEPPMPPQAAAPVIQSVPPMSVR